MKKLLLFFIVFTSTYSFSQTQIGSDLLGSGERQYFGRFVNVSPDGSTMAVVSAKYDFNATTPPGSVKIFRYINNAWTQIGSDIIETEHDSNGIHVDLSMDGNVIAVGAPISSEGGSVRGRVRVFENVNNDWVQIGSTLYGDNDEDRLGWGVGLSNDGTILAVSALEQSTDGYAKIYENINDEWVQKGSKIETFNINDRIGWTLSLSGDGSTVALGAPWADTLPTISVGEVTMFKFENNGWTQLGQKIKGEFLGDLLGTSIALSNDGNTIAVGAQFSDRDGIENIGFFNVHRLDNDTWVQIGEDITGTDEDEYFGYSLAISADGNTVVVGVEANDLTAFNSGTSFVYQNINDSWQMVSNSIQGDAAGDFAGASVSMSNDASILAVGIPGSDEVEFNSGMVRVYNLESVLSSSDIISSKLSMYPNPANDQFTLELKENIQLQRVSIYNQLGQMVKTSREETTDVRELSSGLYFVEILTDLGKSSQKLIIK